MDENQVKELLNTIGYLIINKDWPGLESYLPEWIKCDQLRSEIKKEILETIEDWELEDNSWPMDVETGFSYDGLDELNPYFKGEVHPSINDENFRYWCCIALLADDEDEMDCYADLWVLLIQREDSVEIGYYELKDPD